MAKAENKSVGKPDEVRKFEKGQIDLVNIGGGVVGKATFQPGWRWSEHVKPIAKTCSWVAHQEGVGDMETAIAMRAPSLVVV